MFPAFVPALSTACSIESVVRIPKITGTPVRNPTCATPLVASLATMSKWGVAPRITAPSDKAVRQRASDIHIEPTERKVRVRYRIDGALYERAKYDINVLNAMVARIKIIGGMAAI